MPVDVTEVNCTEEALRQAQKLKAVGELTSGIAHDFNNYLTVIATSLEMLQSACRGRPRAVRLVRQSQAAAAQAKRLVSQLLGFSRRQALQPESLNCNEVVIELRELLRRALPTGINLRLVMQQELWHIRADLNQLETAILNLVVNARDAMPEGGGRITLRTANITVGPTAGVTKNLAEGDYVEVSISDTGQGMPPAVLARAFEPFYTTKAPGKGSGLGLSQVYGFAKQSDGCAEIESREGVGTTVRLLLPRDVTKMRPST